MAEFTLPDRIRDLAVVERRLKDELSRREDDLRLLYEDTPPYANAMKTPAFWAMMVAHRKWQHAHEKLFLLRRKKASRVP